MKKFAFLFIMILSIMLLASSVSAASSSLKGGTTSNINVGKIIKDKSIVINLSGQEVKYLKNTITVALDGATFECEDEVTVNDIVKYSKVDDSKIKISLNPTKNEMEKGYNVNLPITFKITKVMKNIKATVNYGYADIKPSVFPIATGEETGVSISKVLSVAKGDKFYQVNGSSKYSTIYIKVSPTDAEKVARSSVTLTMDGFKFTDYKTESGNISSNRGNIGTYILSPNKEEIKMYFNTLSADMREKGYTINFPMTGTVTKEGEIKAKVNFGVEGIEDSEVVVARTDGGELRVYAENPQAPIETSAKVSSIVIEDNSYSGYSYNQKIYLHLNQVFHFVGDIKLEATGKFQNKCRIDVDKNDSQKAVLTITNAVSEGSTGTIKIVSPYIERSKNVNNKFNSVEVKMTSPMFKDNTYNPTIATFKEGGNAQKPIDVTVSPVSGKKYAFLNTIVISDYGRGLKAGEKYKISFDHNYKVFTRGSLPYTITEGVYKDNCQLSVENGEIYITIPKSTPVDKEGKIKLANVILEIETVAAFNDSVNLIMEIGSETTTVPVFNYSSIFDRTPATTTTVATTTTTTTTEATTEATTSSSQDIKFTIGKTGYVAKGEKKELLAPPYIKDGYTMLPMRAIANLVGISDENISYEKGVAEFKLNEALKLVVTNNSPTYSLAGKEMKASTSAEIVNGTFFLPMRDLATAIGIKSENLLFNGETKEVTIKLG